MIDIKYKKSYEAFIKHYKDVHPCPWHQISEEELNKIYDYLVGKMDVNNLPTFCYFMNYLIKRLSGLEDAHTQYLPASLLPMNYRMIDGEILINYPEELKGSILLSINDVDINEIIKELDEILIYGTEGRRRSEIENSLFNRNMLLGLPSLRECKKLVFKIRCLNGEILEKSFERRKDYGNEMFDTRKYLFGNPGEYEFINDTLVYKHSSVQSQYEEAIKNSIGKLRKEDLFDIKRIIVDLRGNMGGNSKLNDYLMDFLKENTDKELIVLTDYRVFSSGRFALSDLLKLGAITIGEEIGTPFNCFGESNSILINGHSFTSSSAYFWPDKIEIRDKENFEKYVTNEMRIPDIFKPDVYVSTTKEDYIDGIDTVLEYALCYNKNNLLRK